ncbi:FecCD family ABC transporter permease [Acetohalobium arabaticum]|uniref:Transport system permease protein n=1 Tax=Acetohalobium arabaticum (strain ATCC 49924 / DSM 5501 / Z-7288) TaxID=574087 RepID=D9QVR2_ACEAZ|nr:iron ABC transporter permease [Acetohalobium arabaticum]ADL12321.1 transport system permease protein [Acetohalobium arabaticum DSM 5501]
MAKKEGILAEYQKYTGKKVLFGAVLILLLILLTMYSIAVGAVKIPIAEVVTTLLGSNTGNAYTIIWNIRLPRVLAAIAAGMGLSVSGAAMQSILKNPLGSPYTLGISHAAAFGAAFSIVVLGAGSLQSSSADAVILNNPYITTISAFVWALISTGVILILTKYKNATPETMILTGVALSSLFTAGTTALQYFASDVEIASIVFWTFGDVGRVTWNNLLIISLAVIPSSVYFMYNSWNYSALASGKETAKSLGVNVEKIRLHGMLISSFVTALIVSFVGIIGFVGLVAPHIVRKIIGGDEKYLIPVSCLVGGLLLLASDTAARTVIAPIVLPVGILTSFLGAPLFIYLVLKGRRYW